MKDQFLRLLRLIAPFAAASAADGAQGTPEENFWKWFQANESAIFDFENDREHTFDRLGVEMHKIDPSITFEFGPKENGRREFVISADGIRGAFPAVEKLYSTAPHMPRWTFIKFRPRRAPADTTYQDVSVKAATVVTHLDLKAGKADIMVFIPGYTDRLKPTYTAITFLLLDQALGEYDVETHVGEIEVQPIGKAPAGSVPLSILPIAFDRLFARM